MAGSSSSNNNLLLSNKQLHTVQVPTKQMERQQQQQHCSHPATAGHLLVLQLQAAVA
jgi:hypothetical protein